MRQHGMRCAAALGAALLVLGWVHPGWGASGAAADLSASGSPLVSVTTTIDDRPVGDSTDKHPVVLHPSKPTTMQVTVRNDATAPITVHVVRLEGKVMQLAFFAYDTSVDMTVDAGQTGDRRFDMDLLGMRGQAVGLIPSRVVILDRKRKALASQGLVVDVRGSLFSVYGLFGLLIAAATVAALIRALVRLARHQLPQNRWLRALTFATPGFGLGLVAVFTVSALRLYAPEAGTWLPLVAGFTVAFFVVGYLTPAPPEVVDEDEDEDEDDEDKDTGLVAVGTGAVGARATGQRPGTGVAAVGRPATVVAPPPAPAPARPEPGERPATVVAPPPGGAPMPEERPGTMVAPPPEPPVAPAP